MANYVINLQASMEYEIYPEIIFYNPVTQDQISVFPLQAWQSRPFYWQAFLSINSTYTIDISEAISGDINISSGGAFFRIINNSGISVNFWQGNYLLTSAKRVENISKGTTENFFIAFSRNPDGSTDQSQYVPNLKIGTAANTLFIQERSYEADVLYEITVTGSNATNLQLSTAINRGKIDLNSIVGF
jgi:hypothetical protein